MKLADFDYHLPAERIAQYPLKERDAARLLVVHRQTGVLEHRKFFEIADYLYPGDLLVLNDTKVLPSRLIGRRLSGGRVEFFLLARKSGLTFRALVRPAKIRLGETVIFNNGSLRAARTAADEVTFEAKSAQEVYRHGQIPLPPYIKRQPEVSDEEYYQTVYAKQEGAVASPTAGLHFTGALLEHIRQRGIGLAQITLHVGHATFNPVKAADIRQHAMGSEKFNVGSRTRAAIKKTKESAGRIIAVGTTSCRALETFAAGKCSGETNIFIYPGYEWRITDGLVTNFHLPKTSLFMLVCAFAGTELMRRAYAQAVREEYRFYSYGDAMLII